MRVSEIAPAIDFPHVQGLLERVLDDQFADVRAMLKLPLPEAGIHAACNFAIVSTLCNLISGISVTLFKPTDTLSELQTECLSGAAFKKLVGEFFPRSESVGDYLPERLYGLCRNPLAHSAGLLDPGSPAVSFVKVYHGSRSSGWTDNELADLETGRFRLQIRTFEEANEELRLHCDGFYFDTVEMLRCLTANREQMEAASRRFAAGISIWRVDRRRR